MHFNDEREHTHFGTWYEQVASAYLKGLPARQAASLEPITLHLHDPDPEVELLHHKHLLYLGSAVDGTQVILYPERIEEATKDDTSRFDLTIACLTKATNDLSRWSPHPLQPKLKT